MPVVLLGDELAFPPVANATEDGVVAVGGDVSPERLVLAYSEGIFPWPVRGYPLLWFSPDPRFVLPLREAHLGRSLRKAMRRSELRISFDEAFLEVIDACAQVPRPGQNGTWITDELRAGYLKLHQFGFAHSVEAWEGDRLVGGLYGVSLGGAFFGESMFSRSRDASKIAFGTLLGHLAMWNVGLVDCQVYTEHLERFGARDWPRDRFLEALDLALEQSTHRGKWKAELSPVNALDSLDAYQKER